MTKRVFWKGYHLEHVNPKLGYRELYFEEAGDRCRNMILNYLTTCELWQEDSENPFIGAVGEIEVTHEEWENLLLNQDLLGIDLLPYPEEENP